LEEGVEEEVVAAVADEEEASAEREGEAAKAIVDRRQCAEGL
jgi:hypothetical protein